MSKKEKKATKTVATEKETKKVDAKSQVENTKQEEQKKEAPVEEKLASTETKETKKETSKETKKEEPKKEEKKETKKPKKEEKVPTFVPEEVNENEKKAIQRAEKVAGIPVGSTTSSLDGKAMLAYVMMERYGKNEELAKRYPELYNDMLHSVDAVVLLSLIDVQKELKDRNDRGELILTLKPEQIVPLQSMANALGIELAPTKALPGATDGQMQLNFSESKIPEELTEKVNTPEKVQLDPKKITTEDELKTALNHLINGGDTKKKNMAENIVNTVEWYRVYRITKEEDANKKLELDNYSVKDWINEIFSLIEPKGLLLGLGSALYVHTSQSGNPIKAHSLLHHYISKLGWSEQQIADLLKCLIQAKFQLDLKDKKVETPKDSKAVQAIISNLGESFIEKIFNDANGEDGDEKSSAKAILGVVRTNYFAKDKVPTPDELRMKIGQIINLYRDPADRLAAYESDNVELKQGKSYPESEKKNLPA